MRWYFARVTNPIQLNDSASNTLVIEPDAGCVATSWRVNDREVLALPSPREEFLRSSRTGGVPLLYPYANRLRSDHFQVAGRAVNLSVDAKLKRDSTGLPIHGLLLRWSEWNLNQPSPGRLEASIRWSDHPTLMAAYPFAHTLKVIWEVARDSSAATLTVTTIIEADHGQAVAIAFGWHPYMAVANAASAQIELPRRRPVALAPSGLPILATPKSDWIGASTEAVGQNQDSLFEIEPSAGSTSIAIIDGSDRTEIRFEGGYNFLQVYSPTNAKFACAEPMTTATSALTDMPTVIASGERAQAIFQMRRKLC